MCSLMVIPLPTVPVSLKEYLVSVELTSCV